MNNKQRYLTFSQSLIEKFGEKVCKIPIDAGMTCPNIDGTVSTKGCIYCQDGSHYKAKSIRKLNVKEQIQTGITSIKERIDTKKFIAFFQAFSSTYASVDRLKILYDQALSVDGVVGLSIATRPDCLSDEILDLLEYYSRKTYLWLEIGIQSVNDKTLKFVNRGHNFECFSDAVSRAKKRKIMTCAHAILYLPEETTEDMMETAKTLAKLELDGIKLHHLHVLKETQLHKLYHSNKISLPSMTEYVNTVCNFLEHLPYNMIVHRVVGDAPRSRIVAPEWTLNKFAVINAINNEMRRRDSYQGVRYVGSRI